ncbi:MAG: endopeptidase La [Bacteroidales bacterium]|nr:endopeptidase La [Bacteroidales bacterium]
MKFFDEKLLNQMEGGDINILPVMSIEANAKTDKIEVPQTLPILAMRDSVLFPGTILPVTIGRDKSVKLIRALNNTTRIIGTATQIDVHKDDPRIADLYEIGCSAKILKLIEMPDGALTAVLQGIRRFRLEQIIAEDPYLIGKIENISDIYPARDDKDIKALSDSIKESALRIVKYSSAFASESEFAIKNIDSFEFLTNFIATTLDNDAVADKIKLLMESDIKQRAYKLLGVLSKQIEILKIKDDIQQKVKSEMDQQQREYYLNNQLKTIQEELGMSGNSKDVSELLKKAADKKWPEYARKEFDRCISRLEKMNPNTPDYNVELNYLELVVHLPWDEITQDNLDLKHARQVLDEDHFGLDKIKDRIVEFLAVLKLRGNMKSPIICLYGPPGTGKTSLGKSVARALGRKYQRISLGGLHDESEIRGHRKTYIGAMPGRIMQAINRAGSSNPVIVLDEIDKVSNDYHGDPASALLEVLDPEQNTTFHDNYLDIDYDLSRVLFITTANNISTIQPALKDRMEMIPLSGYLAEEKFHIAKDYLVPKQVKEHGLKQEQLRFGKGAIEEIIDEYTRESGVRQLDKQIAKIARHNAMLVASDEKIPQEIEVKDVKEILGLPTNQHDLQKDNEAPGVVTGLAWTEMGGEILFVECIRSEGKGMLTTTGNLGDVMKESATIAYQWLKANTKLLGMTPAQFKKYDLHVHVPEGAIPKDGPSAGITMVSAMASALMGKKVKSRIAMTGEMTLRGKVLPVGGIKEKILAAKRAGVTTIVLSEDNRKDIAEIKPVYIKGLKFKYVKKIDEVIKFIFS